MVILENSLSKASQENNSFKLSNYTLVHSVKGNEAMPVLEIMTLEFIVFNLSLAH